MPSLSNGYPVYKRPPRPPLPFVPKRNAALDQRELDNFSNFTHCMSYIWTKQGEGCWVYPTRFCNNTVYGYGGKSSRWVPVTISYRDIEAYY